MTGFETVSVSGYTLEKFKSGGQAVRGSGGKFAPYKVTGKSHEQIASMFKTMEMTAKQQAKTMAGGTFDKSVTMHGVTLEVAGFDHVIYTLNYFEQLLRNFKSYEPQLQAAMQMVLGETIQDFVMQIVRPKAEEIIIELVYAPAMQRVKSSMQSRIAVRKRGKKYKDSDATFKKDQSYAQVSEKLSIGRSRYAQREQAIRERGVGYDAPTYGARREAQLGARLGKKAGAVFGHEEFTGFGGASALRPPFNYQGPSGRLLRSLMSGIRAVGASIQIGIDSTILGDKPYWLFVERGHGYLIPTGRVSVKTTPTKSQSRWPSGGRKMSWLPYREPEKPFLRTLNSWMLSEGRQLLEKWISQRVEGMLKEVSVLLEHALRGTELQLGTLQGKAIKEYTKQPGRFFNPDDARLQYMKQGFNPSQVGGLSSTRSYVDENLADLMGSN